jgi:hypothetical protein
MRALHTNDVCSTFSGITSGTVEAYVDDIVVKTRKADDMVHDLRIAFGCLRANGVKLNPEKCVFGVPRGMLLGYIVSQRGIEANPEKVAALERMGPIRDLKGVQKVLGCLAALSRFISRLGEKGLPLYRLLKKHKRFSWTVEAQEALDKLKAMKTRKADDMVHDLRIAFGCLRANGVKLNPEKCVFGVPRGMLLGYIVSQRGIEANPEKVAALERMGPIRDLKGVQKVLGCLAALSRFISRLGEKGLPLYRLLKKHKRFSWTVEAQEALDKLKAMLAHAPILTPPQDGEPLYLYVAATTQVVSAVIVVERTEEGHALPV